MGPEGINNLAFHLFAVDKNGKTRKIQKIEEFPDTVSEYIGIKRVIFNDPATIVFWDDGTKNCCKMQRR